MDLVDTVGRHRWVALLTLVVIMAATVGYVATQKPVYQSTDTLQLSSADATFFSDVNTLTPLYSELLTAQQTLAIAQTYMGSVALADVSVRIFTNSPILKLDASGGSASQVQRSAAAVVNALRIRLILPSSLGASGVTLALVDGPSSADVVWPRPALTLGAAAIVGLLLAIAMSWLADALGRGLAAAGAAAPTGPASVTRGTPRVTPAMHVPATRDIPPLTAPVPIPPNGDAKTIARPRRAPRSSSLQIKDPPHREEAAEPVHVPLGSAVRRRRGRSGDVIGR